MNEDRTTEEERRYIMEARKRAMLKRKKLRTLGKSRDELNWEPVVGVIFSQIGNSRFSEGNFNVNRLIKKLNGMENR